MADTSPAVAIQTGGYDSIVRVSIYFSVWLLSCILLYTYNHKRLSNIEYNKLISQINTKKLKNQIVTLEEKVQQYRDVAYPDVVSDSTLQSNPNGKEQAKKELYTELVKTIEIYDKCNLVRSTTKGSPIPWTEIMIAVVMIVILVAIIIIFNKTNSPLETNKKAEKIENLKTLIEQSFDGVKQKATEMKVNQANFGELTKKLDKKFKGGAVIIRGGEEVDLDSKIYKTYNNLLRANMLVSQKLTAMQSNQAFNYSIVAVSIVIFAIYMSISLFKNAISFTDNLYSGSLFMNSRCYNL